MRKELDRATSLGRRLEDEVSLLKEQLDHTSNEVVRHCREREREQKRICDFEDELSQVREAMEGREVKIQQLRHEKRQLEEESLLQNEQMHRDLHCTRGQNRLLQRERDALEESLRDVQARATIEFGSEDVAGEKAENERVRDIVKQLTQTQDKTVNKLRLAAAEKAHWERSLTELGEANNTVGMHRTAVVEQSEVQTRDQDLIHLEDIYEAGEREAKRVMESLERGECLLPQWGSQHAHMPRTASQKAKGTGMLTKLQQMEGQMARTAAECREIVERSRKQVPDRGEENLEGKASGVASDMLTYQPFKQVLAAGDDFDCYRRKLEPEVEHPLHLSPRNLREDFLACTASPQTSEPEGRRTPSQNGNHPEWTEPPAVRQHQKTEDAARVAVFSNTARPVPTVPRIAQLALQQSIQVLDRVGQRRRRQVPARTAAEVTSLLCEQAKQQQ